MKDLIQNIKVIILSTIVILSVSFVYAAWTDPTANPTGGNTDAPINVGTADQIKNGGLIVNAFSALQNAYFAGNVGIGTASPEAKLHVVGNIKIIDGNQVAGKVLTSDASGLASWQPNMPSSGNPVPNNIQTFTTTSGGTWVKPQGVSRVYVKIVGGGGGGGGSFVATNNKGQYVPSAGGPGGAGGYSEGYVTVTGDVFVTVGSGGILGANGANSGSNYGNTGSSAGTNGGTSSFGSMIAYGGMGGAGAGWGQTGSGGEGGNASGGQVNIKSSNGDDGIKSILSTYGDGGRGNKPNSCANSCSDAKIGTDGKPGLVIVYY